MEKGFKNKSIPIRLAGPLEKMIWLLVNDTEKWGKLRVKLMWDYAGMTEAESFVENEETERQNQVSIKASKDSKAAAKAKTKALAA